jgi:hypothetical protein
MLFNNRQSNNQKNTLKSNFVYRLLSFKKQNQAGTTLITGTAIGLLGLGTGTLAIAQANQLKTNVVSDEMTKQAIAVAETGVTRMQSLFIKEPRLAMVSSHNEWTTIANTAPTQLDTVLNNTANTAAGTSATTSTATYSCSPSSGTTAGTSLTSQEAQEIIDQLQGGAIKVPSNIINANNTWVALDPNNPDKGKFKLVSYSRGTGANSKASLTIQGQVGSNNASKAQIKVDFDANVASGGGGGTIPSTAEQVPGLWISEVGNDWANDKVNGNIKIYSPTCKTLAQITGAPDNSNLYNTSTQSISISKEPIPDTPPLPTSNLYTVTGSVAGMTFPRPGDTPDTNGHYHYLINNLDISGGSNVTIVDNAKVIFYVRGNINLSGNPDINPSASNTSKNLQIYGNTYTTGNNTKYGCGSLTVGTNCPTLQAHFNGTGTVKAFVHAPAATGSVNGGGNTNGNFRGSMWIKAWDSSSGNSKVKIDAVGNYGDYQVTENRTVPNVTPPTYTLGNISNYERQNAQ